MPGNTSHRKLLSRKTFPQTPNNNNRGNHGNCPPVGELVTGNSRWKIGSGNNMFKRPYSVALKRGVKRKLGDNGFWRGAAWRSAKNYYHVKSSTSSMSPRTEDDESSPVGYESTIISEAHGLITDMLADPNLPPNVVSGLRAVSSLLKPPPDPHGPSAQGHRPKVSPLVSLTEATNYGSDNEDSPYTGERPSTLPKRLRRSLPPSLIRRMSTSTWTTTTSATGLPTLESDPVRTRSSSFRHSRDNTPGSSPQGSRSNSPSPSSPTNSISLTIPKSRSFSLASTMSSSPSGNNQGKRSSRERRGFHQSEGNIHAKIAGSDAAMSLSPGSGSSLGGFCGGSGISEKTKTPSPLATTPDNFKSGIELGRSISEPPPSGTGLGGLGGTHSTAHATALAHASPPVTRDLHLHRRLNITSDYESSDSPGSSDHSDNVTSVDDTLPSSRTPDRATTDRRPLTVGDESVKSGIRHEKLEPCQPAEDSISEHSEPSSAGGGASRVAPPGSSGEHTHQPPATPETPDTTTTGGSRLETTTESTTTTGTSQIHGNTNNSSSTSSQSKPATSSTTTTTPQLSSTPSKTTTNIPPHQIVTSSQVLVTSPYPWETVGVSTGPPHVHHSLPYNVEDIDRNELLSITKLNKWDFPIFDLAKQAQTTILSQVAYKLFTEVGLFETFRIPVQEFMMYFHNLELGYQDKPYHNRVHATDVLHGVYYISTQPIPGFTQICPDARDVFSKNLSSSESDSETSERVPHTSFTAEDTYGIMGGNFPALELMAMYTAAAMHDYDHPGRTNAFLVTTHSPLAVLYNDRSVLESHHAASAWRLLLSNPQYNWLVNLEKGEFNRFRFLVIEAILATDLKRHFEILAEFDAKVNDVDATGIDWTLESDRLMASNMVIKLADINGPCKVKDLHVDWTYRITEEFYEQGDEEASMGLPISAYMDRRSPQLAKLQESFINHLVAPLCNAVANAGLLPGTWVEDELLAMAGVDSDSMGDSSACKDTEDEDTEPEGAVSSRNGKGWRNKNVRKINCLLTKNLKNNHDMWVAVLHKEQSVQAALLQKDSEGLNGVPEPPVRCLSKGEKEMEPIKEEETPPSSASSLKGDPQKSHFTRLANTTQITIPQSPTYSTTSAQVEKDVKTTAGQSAGAVHGTQAVSPSTDSSKTALSGQLAHSVSTPSGQLASTKSGQTTQLAQGVQSESTTKGQVATSGPIASQHTHPKTSTTSVTGQESTASKIPQLSQKSQTSLKVGQSTPSAQEKQS